MRDSMQCMQSAILLWQMCRSVLSNAGTVSKRMDKPIVIVFDSLVRASFLFFWTSAPLQNSKESLSGGR